MDLPCTICKQTKDSSLFSKSRHVKTGFDRHCKQCKAEFHKKRYARDRDKILAKNADWYVRNKEERRQSMKKWAQENKEKFSEYVKKYRERNPEKVKQLTARINKRYRTEKPEWYVQSVKKSRLKNREKTLEHLRRWQKSEHGMALMAASRAKRLGLLVGTFTPKEWKSILNGCGRVCLLCGLPEKECIYKFSRSGNRTGTLTVDHIIPLSKGGANEAWNLQPLCQPCQLKKSTKVIDYRPAHVRAMFPPPESISPLSTRTPNSLK